jgi:hypothetical protein
MERSVNTLRLIMLIMITMVGNFLIAQNTWVTVISHTVENDLRELVQENPLQINIWHGLQQKVGHLGHAQDDFNLMGNVIGHENLASLTYSLNGTAPVELTIGRGKFGDTRRLAAPGDFNADIAISKLRDGRNAILVNAIDSLGGKTSVTVYVDKFRGAYPLPVHIKWNKVSNPQDVGQYIDGLWALEKEGLRTVRTGYDRVFLIGDTTWMDYEVTVPFIFHRADPETGPVSGGNGIGILMRFTGHAVGGHRNFPAAQPKWGYQPFGAIGLLRWKDGPNRDPSIQFFRGDNDQTLNFGTMSLVPGHHYQMKMRCVTLPDDGDEGVTRYSFKIWRAQETEPAQWNLEVDQKSKHALRKGGVVLLAHHVDATFGNVQAISVTSVIGKQGQQPDIKNRNGKL